MEANAEEAFELIHLIQETKRLLCAPPRYAVGIAPADQAPGARGSGRAIAKTLACYAAAHASELDLRAERALPGGRPLAAALCPRQQRLLGPHLRLARRGARARADHRRTEYDEATHLSLPRSELPGPQMLDRLEAVHSGVGKRARARIEARCPRTRPGLLSAG